MKKNKFIFYKYRYNKKMEVSAVCSSNFCTRITLIVAIINLLFFLTSSLYYFVIHFKII